MVWERWKVGETVTRMAASSQFLVYLLSAQFPGPTTPRDFVTMFLTSDQALADQSGGEREVPRHFMVISRPCSHPEAPPRDGFIRGQYESVEFIREIPLQKGPKKSASTTNLLAHGRNRSGSLGREAIMRNAKKNYPPPMGENGVSTNEKAAVSENDLAQSETRARGKTISFDKSRGFNAKGENMDIPPDEDEINPVEWIMITRSDPGGSVPRFMIERGTPGGIVSDASKFLNWACAKDIEDFDSDDETLPGEESSNQHEHKHHHNHEKDLHNYQTNGHLAGIEEVSTPTEETNGGGLYGLVDGAAGAAGGYIASHTPAIISDHLPSYVPPEQTNGDSRRDSVSSISSASSAGSFASALENNEDNNENDASSTKTTESVPASLAITSQDKELKKLAEKMNKLNKAREKEMAKQNKETAKEEEAIKKIEAKHERELQKLEIKKQKEEQKIQERKRKAVEKDEKTKSLRELEQAKSELALLRKEKEILRSQVGALQAENTVMAARLGKLGGEDALNEIRAEVSKGGRLRASSLKGLSRTTSFKSGSSGESEKEKENSPLAQVS